MLVTGAGEVFMDTDGWNGANGQCCRTFCSVVGKPLTERYLGSMVFWASEKFAGFQCESVDVIALK